MLRRLDILFFVSAPVNTRMAFTLNREECDLTVQGAVVLGSGGGGPLSFARYMYPSFNRSLLVVQQPQNYTKP
jgi:hypothetical protein